jgi:hypothetical protein
MLGPTRMLMDLWWLGPLAWAFLYVSDYALTIACARLYLGQDRIAFEGSYEITPVFQRDVNALRRISPRFLAILVASTAYLAWLSLATERWDFRGPYRFTLGGLLLTELMVHMRHLRNWFLFRWALGVNGVRGRLEYPRGVLLRTSALEVFLFTLLYGFLCLVTGDVFVLGGALACAVLAGNHYRLARRHDASRLKAA